MSLSWRKRQAIASDQQTWRGLGHDSALWTSIENNASTVNAVVAGPTAASRSGIVTGLRFIKTDGLINFGEMSATQDVYVSDPSDNTVDAVSGVNQYNTPFTSGSGRGLIFTFRKFGAEDFTGAPLGTDISGLKYTIENGGSGYSVGEDILLSGDGAERGQRRTISSLTGTGSGLQLPQLPTGSGTPAILADGIITQDAYNVISITITNTGSGATVVKGCPVTIHSVAEVAANNGNILAAGFLRSTATLNAGTSSTPVDTTISVEVVSGMADFTQSALSIFFNVEGTHSTGSIGFDTFTVGNITDSFPQANGFIPTGSAVPSSSTYPSAGQLTSGDDLMQTDAEFLRKSFEQAGAPLRNSAGVIILSRQEMANITLSSPAAGQIKNVLPELSVATWFQGVLRARVTSVADTTPVQGRN